MGLLRYLEILRDICTTTYQICRGKNKLNNHISQMSMHFTNEYVLLKLEIHGKYCGKEEKLLLTSNSPLFHNNLLPVVRIFMLKQGPDFHFERSGYSS